MTYPISLHSNSGRFARWLGVNLLAYVGGAVIFGVGFLVFATLYAHLVPKPSVIPTQPAVIPTQPAVTPTQPSSPAIQTAPSPPATAGMAPVATPALTSQPQLQLPLPIAKLTDQDLIGKKLVSPQGVFLGYIVSVNRNAQGEPVSLEVKKSEGNAPVFEVKLTPLH
jgi:hypothetical protein